MANKKATQLTRIMTVGTNDLVLGVNNPDDPATDELVTFTFAVLIASLLATNNFCEKSRTKLNLLGW